MAVLKHIVIYSLRKYDKPKEDYMERNCDSLAGYKHHLANGYLKHLQKSLMDLCHRENLHQVDLLSPAENKVKNQEYYASRYGQEKLDKLNEQILADGLTPRKTTFQTQKQYLRDAITEISHIAKDIEDFKKQIYEKYQIVVTDHWGRFSYLHPEREKILPGVPWEPIMRKSISSSNLNPITEQQILILIFPLIL